MEKTRVEVLTGKTWNEIHRIVMEDGVTQVTAGSGIPALDLEVDFAEEEVKNTAGPRGGYAMVKGVVALEDEEIVKLYRSSMTVKEILATAGITSGTLYNILNSVDEPLREGRRRNSVVSKIDKMSESTVKDIIDLYQAGIPLVDLLDEYDIHRNGLYNLLDAHKVPRRNNVKDSVRQSVASSEVPDTERLREVGMDAPVITGVQQSGEEENDVLEFSISKDLLEGKNKIVIKLV